MSLDDQPVQDAEVVTSDQAEESTFDIDAYNATLETVRRRLTILDKAREELKKLNEMHQDVYTNDAFYNDAEAVVKDAQKRKKEVKSTIEKKPEAAQISGKVKDLREQIKDNEDMLSQELMEYYRTSGVTEIEDADGNVQEFTIKVKLKPKKRAER